METVEIAVIGAGIAGASVAAELSADASVILLEAETQAGYHTTGRSAAVYAPVYGPPPIRALTRASESFFRSPPTGFSDHSLFAPRPVLMIARHDQMDALEGLIADVSAETSVTRLTGADMAAAQPLLRPDYAMAGMLDRNSQDIDVGALHQGYLKLLRHRGGRLMTDAAVTALERDGQGWRIATTAGEVRAGRVVNAAGAWADAVGALAGAEEIGLVPKRRTALIVAAPDGIAVDPLPITVDVEEQFYLKPDAGRLLISPADETPSPPYDAQPDEMDVAVCIDRIQTAFALDVRRIETKWAGLRSFVADKSPVAGWSRSVDDFYWLAGQGGYGIQSAPGLARYAAAEILGRAMPSDIAEAGLDPASVRPQRLQEAAASS